MAFVGIIIICLVYTIGEYIYNGSEGPNKRNQRLLDRAEKLDTKKNIK